MKETYITRASDNPLITPKSVVPSDVGMRVIGVFNAGAIKYMDQILLLLRVTETGIPNPGDAVKVPMVTNDGKLSYICIDESHFQAQYRTDDTRSLRKKSSKKIEALSSLSHFRLARSFDGIHFDIDTKPTIFPQESYEQWGIEDARITCIDNIYYIVYTAVSKHGMGAALISTLDFVAFERHGMIFPPENKDVCFFSEQIDGRYVALHRPVPKNIGSPDIWMAYSDNLHHWGNHVHILSTRPDTFESERIGAGAPPIKTNRGWLHIYHGANEEKRYCLGVFLTALEDPACVIARAETPLLEPEAPYETEGFFNQTVFTCGAILNADESVNIYYGVTDDSLALATTTLDKIWLLLGI